MKKIRIFSLGIMITLFVTQNCENTGEDKKEDKTSTNTTSSQVAPTLSYSGSPFTFDQNLAITSITPTLEGSSPISCIISPALPSGLSIDTSSCVITGTPTNVQSATTYTITASNSIGNKSTSINITVKLCSVGQGGRINVGTSNSFLNKVIDSGSTIECSFKAQFNDGTEKVIYITSNGNGQTVRQTDSCSNTSTVTATEPDTFIAAEILDEFFENITDSTSPANDYIIPGVGAGNVTTNATHVTNLRGSFGCGY